MENIEEIRRFREPVESHTIIDSENGDRFLIDLEAAFSFIMFLGSQIYLGFQIQRLLTEKPYTYETLCRGT